MAEKRLAKILPLVGVLTDADGAKLISIQEVIKIEKRMIELEEQARKEGFEKGHKEGLEEGLLEARKVLQDFNRAIQDLINQRESLLEEARQKVLELVMQISRKVTFDAIRIDPEASVAMIGNVIDTLVDRSHLKIKVNVDHLPLIEQGIERFLQSSAMIKEITIEADPRVRYGGCMIETPTGDIDARLESQLDVIAEALEVGQEKP